MATETKTRAGWLGIELAKYPCVYGVQVIGRTGRHEDRPCGRPSVYRTIGGGEADCYCDRHAPEVEANDQATYG